MQKKILLGIFCFLLLPLSHIRAQTIDQTTLQNYQNNCLNSAGQPIQLPSCIAIQNQIQTSLNQLQQNYQNNCINGAGQPIQLPSCTSLQNQIQTTQQSIGINTSGGTDVTKAPYTLLTPLPCNSGLGVTCNGVDSSGNQAITSISLSQFVSYAYKLMLALAVFLAVFMITVGGFEYMLSGATNKKEDAKKKIEDAVWGLLLALIAYLLLYTIDPNLVSQNNLSIPPISNPTSSGVNNSGGGTNGGTNGGSSNNGNGTFCPGGGSSGGGGAGCNYATSS